MAEQKVKVLEFIPALNMGGAETLIKDYCLTLDKNIFDVTVLCSLKHGYIYEKFLEKKGIKVVYAMDCKTDKIRKSIFTRAIFALRRKLRIKKIISKIKPDVIHSHLDVYSDLLFAHPPVTTKIFHTVHNETNYAFNLKKQKIKAIKKLIKRNHLRFITLHEQMRKEVNDLFKIENTLVLNNGINFSRYEINTDRSVKRKELGIPEDAFVIGHIGRMETQKNHIFLLEIFREIYSRNPKAFLVLIGKGMLQDNIKSTLSDWNIKNYLILKDRLDVPEILKTFDRFILPSLYEGLPLVLIESQAARILTFASTVCSIASKTSNYIEYIPLEKTASEWAKQILAANKRDFQKINMEDWNINKVVKKMESWFKK